MKLPQATHHDIDRIIHLAADSDGDRSMLGPRASFDTNVTGRPRRAPREWELARWAC